MSIAKLKAYIVFGIIGLITLSSVIWALTTDTTGNKTEDAVCSQLDSQNIPASSSVSVNVYNASGIDGLANSVAEELRQRGFIVADVRNEPHGQADVDKDELRYGLKAVAGAQLLRTHLINYSLKYVGDMTNSVVDIVLGKTHAELTPLAGVPNKIRALGPMKKLVPQCG